MVLSEVIASKLYFWSLKGLLFVFVLLVTWLSGRIVRFVIGRLSKRSIPYFYTTLQEYGKWLTWLSGFLVALGTLGLSEGALLVAVVLLGVGFLMSTKDALQNIFARPFIDISSDFNVGDWIRIGDIAGRVIEVNSISTLLITKAGEMAVIPNKTFLRETVINESYQAGYELTIPIVVKKDVDEVLLEQEIMKIAESQRKYIKPGVNPNIVTIAASDRSKELALIIVLKDRQDKLKFVEAINDGVKQLLDRL